MTDLLRSQSLKKAINFRTNWEHPEIIAFFTHEIQVVFFNGIILWTPIDGFRENLYIYIYIYVGENIGFFHL